MAMMPQPTTLLHGVFMNVYGIGTLLTGESGTGKSAIALALIHRGHQFIADDAPEFFSTDGQTLTGRAPAALQNFLELRGVGLVNVLNLFGPQAVGRTQSLSLIIHLKRKTHLERTVEAPLEDFQSILNIPVRRLHLSFKEQGGSELLIETLVRYHLAHSPSLSESAVLHPPQFQLGIPQ